MAAEKGIDWAALVPELEKEIAKMFDLLALARMKAGMTASPGITPTGETTAVSVARQLPSGDSPSEIRLDTFFGMTVAEAIRTYLGMMKRPVRAVDIARALEQGGLLHNSRNWLNTVQSTLTRQKGELVKLPNGWGLSEWYPGRNFEKVGRSRED